MRNITLYLFAVPFLLAGCTRYQYATVSGTLPVDERRAYVFENDSLMVSYSFNGQNCPVRVSVENKLGIPLYIDWTKSAVVLNGESQTYFEDKGVINASGSSFQINGASPVSSAISFIDGTIRRDESSSFVPPSSKKSTTMIEIDSRYWKLRELKKPTKVRIYSGTSYAVGEQYEFDRDDSPMRFRSFITLSHDPSFKSSFFLDHSFWISRVVETDLSPRRYNDMENDYYKTKTSGAGVPLLIGSVAVLVMAASVEP